MESEAPGRGGPVWGVSQERGAGGCLREIFLREGLHVFFFFFRGRNSHQEWFEKREKKAAFKRHFKTMGFRTLRPLNLGGESSPLDWGSGLTGHKPCLEELQANLRVTCLRSMLVVFVIKQTLASKAITVFFALADEKIERPVGQPGVNPPTVPEVTSIGSLPENLGKSRGPPQNPGETLQNPGKTPRAL